MRLLQFEVNYTYGKSIDVDSDAERAGSWGGHGGQIIKAWDPFSNRGPLDFDLRLSPERQLRHIREL
jgi:hypothetical protein